MAEAEAAQPQPKKARLASKQACESCRRRKQRCDGKRPACSNCDSRGIGVSCIYAAQATNDAISQTPEFVRPTVERQGTALDVVTATEGTDPAAVEVLGGASVRPLTAYGGDFQSPDEGAFYGNSSSLEFVSKLSAANPLERRLRIPERRQSRAQEVRPDAAMFNVSPATSVSSGIKWQIPPPEVADSLVDAYFERVHIFYPCLHEPTFRDELEAYRLRGKAASTDQPVDTDYSWLAILHMLFAYGTEFVVATPKSEDGRLVGAHEFVTQARHLVTVALSEDTRLETVQALLLLSHFLQGTTELNDCWNIGGLLIRTALSIGLHIEPSGAPLSELQKEVRRRVWAGCFIVDRTLSMKFGRPPALPIASAKRVDLPAVVDDQYITNGTTRARQPKGRPSRMDFFVQTIGQAHIIDEILNDLYLDEPRLQTLASSNDRSHTEVLSRLLSKAVFLDGRLQGWWNGLPAHLREVPQEPDSIDFHRQRCVVSLRSVCIMHMSHHQLRITRHTAGSYTSAS